MGLLVMPRVLSFVLCSARPWKAELPSVLCGRAPGGQGGSQEQHWEQAGVVFPGNMSRFPGRLVPSWQELCRGNGASPQCWHGSTQPCQGHPSWQCTAGLRGMPCLGWERSEGLRPCRFAGSASECIACQAALILSVLSERAVAPSESQRDIPLNKSN